MNAEQRKRLLVIVAAVAAALLIADQFIVEPLMKSWRDRTNRIADLRKNVAKGQAIIDREDAIRGRWKEMKGNTLAPDNSEAEDQLLKAFQRWSGDSSVTISSIRPQWKHGSDEFVTLECRVDAAGSLSSLSRFIYNIERDPLAVKVDTVELTARDNNGSQIGLGLLVSALVLNQKDR